MKQFIHINLAVILMQFLPNIPVYAQDIITLRNGDEIRAKVTEISSSDIRYKRFENLDGPTIVIPVANVFFINYENGKREIFNSQTDDGAQPAINNYQDNVRQNSTVDAQAIPAKNLVSNIKVQQNGNMLHVTYDLEERADIEVFVSFDNGVFYRNRPLRHISGAAGIDVFPGKNKLLIWNMVREVGYADFSNVVLMVVANAVVTTENVADTDISIVHPYKYNDRFYAGLTAGMSNNDIAFGLDAAYFFNRFIGTGFAVRNFGYSKTEEYRYWYEEQVVSYSRLIKTRNIFFGPVFYSHLLQTRNGKFFFSSCVGLGGIYKSYIYDDSKSFIFYSDDKTLSFGYFLSGGFAYRPVSLISIGANCEFTESKNRASGALINLGINFHF